MMTDKGPKVLEFNARFGDPETQAIMVRMKSDIVPVLKGVAQGQLRDAKIEWAKEPSACVVIAAKGYPDAPETGKTIAGTEALKGLPDVALFHAGTARKDGALVTVAGRVLGVTALGANLDGAIQRAYEAVAKISFDGMHYRRDIGRKALARLQPGR
jgi:phosphoribosylamine--glycine ligase